MHNSRGRARPRPLCDDEEIPAVSDAALRQLSEKTVAVAEACRALRLADLADRLALAWARFPPTPLANPFAVDALFRALASAESAVAAAEPRRGRSDALRLSIARALAAPIPRIALFAAPRCADSPDCVECGGALRKLPIDFWRGDGRRPPVVCLVCGCEQAGADWDEEECDDSPARPENPSHEKSAAAFLRRLQGHGRDAFELDGPARAALLRCAFRARVNGRNVTVRWMRAALQETGLTALNERIPSIMQDLFRVEIPQLSGEEERALAGRINTDIRDYLALKQGSGRRQNALPCAYLAYRHLDAMFPPGDSRRLLLNFIHLQERRTFERHEDDYWSLCRIHGRPFYAIGLPAPSPFAVRPLAPSRR